MMREAREIEQLFLSHGHLLKSAMAENDAEKATELHLSLLTAPLGRAMGANERLMRVRDVYEFIDGGASGVTKKMPDRLAFGEDMFAFQPGSLVFNDAFVTHEGYVGFDDVFLLDFIQSSTGDWRSGRGRPWFHRHLPFAAYSPTDGSCVVKPPDRSRAAPAFVFNALDAPSNFGHFVHDLLLQLKIYREVAPSHPDILCLFSRKLRYEIQDLIIDRLFPEEKAEGRLLFGGIESRYPYVIVPYPQFLGFPYCVGVEGAKYARERLAALASESAASGNGPTRVFVSRRDEGAASHYGRGEMDHLSIEAVFRELGFEILVVTELRAEQILQAFSRAEVVAGIHGAGLLNVLFSNAETPRLLELGASERSWRSIEAVTRASGLLYSYLAPVMTNGIPTFPGLRASVLEVLREGERQRNSGWGKVGIG